MKLYSVALLIIGNKYTLAPKETSAGQSIRQMIADYPFEIVACDTIPDTAEIIRNTMLLYADTHQVNLILTAGGTGFTATDITPEITRDVIEKETPGICEAMRTECFKITKKAMLSRGVAGIRGKTLIINLPGSSKGVVESLGVILDTLPHAIRTINRI